MMFHFDEIASTTRKIIAKDNNLYYYIDSDLPMFVTEDSYYMNDYETALKVLSDVDFTE